jgi:hypothetical protein
MNIHQNTRPVPIPLYTSRGDAEAFLVYPHLFNRLGEWIGWVTPQREVYSILGHYVGKITDDRRIVRKRMTGTLKPDRTPPPRPARINPPAIVALAPMMSELTVSYMDVLLEEPERLHTVDAGELRQDMD